MNWKSIFSCILISTSLCLVGQDSIKVKKSASQMFENYISKHNPHLRFSVDLFRIGRTFLEDDFTSYEAHLDARVYKKLSLRAEYGVEQNTYTKNDWIYKTDGSYLRIGFDYNLIEGEIDKNEGMYVGLRYATAKYSREIPQFVILHNNGLDTTYGNSGLEEDLKNSWIEIALGTRARLTKLPIYAALGMSIKLLQNDPLENLSDTASSIYIPGFGENNSKINFGVHWTIGYLIDFKKKK